jgi:phosphoglycerol transferase MdoB-like AlkP superfamily enzyme
MFSQEAKALRQAADDAYAALLTAKERYEYTIGLAKDTELNPEGMSDIQQRAQDYATAVIRYSDAVMAWLRHTDANVSEAKKFVKKANGK